MLKYILTHFSKEKNSYTKKCLIKVSEIIYKSHFKIISESIQYEGKLIFIFMHLITEH